MKNNSASTFGHSKEWKRTMLKSTSWFARWVLKLSPQIAFCAFLLCTRRQNIHPYVTHTDKKKKPRLLCIQLHALFNFYASISISLDLLCFSSVFFCCMPINTNPCAIATLQSQPVSRVAVVLYSKLCIKYVAFHMPLRTWDQLGWTPDEVEMIIFWITLTRT